MHRFVFYIILLIPYLTLCQNSPDTSPEQFTRVSGSEFAYVFKNDLFVDSRGLLWAGTEIGLHVYDGYEWKDGITTTIDTLGLSSIVLESVIEDSTGAIWFSVQSRGIFKLDLAERSIHNYLPGDFTGDEIHNVPVQELLIIDDLLIIQTFRGFVRMNPYTCEFVDVHIPFPELVQGGANGLPSDHPANWIHHVLPDLRDKDTYWLGTKTGPVMYDLESRTATSLPWPFDYPQQGAKISILDVSQTENELVLATYGYGIVTYPKNAETPTYTLIEPLDKRDPDRTNVIQSLRKVSDSTFLFASNSGAGIYNQNQRSYRMFDIPASANHGHYRNIICDASGFVWLNNAEAIYRSKEALFPVTHKPELMLTGYAVENGSALTGFDPNVKDLELNEYQNSIELSFALVNPASPAEVVYSFKLEGADNEWHDGGNRRYTRYTQLKGGDYHFYVKAIESDGSAHQKRLLSFTINVPFYKSSWFILVCAALIALTVYWIVRNSLEKERMKTKYDLRIAELEMQALRSQMNPHFIFNSLNSIKNYVVNKGPDEAAEYLSKFAQLVRMILENSKSELLTLEQEINALKAYVEMEQMRYKSTFNCRFNIDPSLDTAGTKIPPMMIQPHIENAIWHGLQHKEGKGNLDITFQAAENGVLCIVHDNGIGRQQAAQMKSKGNKHKSSLGIGITNSRVDMMNSRFGTQSYIEITDLRDSDGSPAGTEVRIFIDQNFNP